MRDSLFLALQYLRHHRLITLVLIASISLILFLPIALQTLVNRAEEHFRERAMSTPLIIGPRGSSLDLVLGSVYFDRPCDEFMRFSQLTRVEKQEGCRVIPLHTRFLAKECQIVGTTKEYLSLRRLSFKSGRSWNRLGQCVIGSAVADQLDLRIGDRIPVSDSSAFILKDAPLRMEVVGILDPNETADDEVIFTDLETTWVIEGYGHGHLKSAKHGSSEASLFTDITAENVDSFHFHGDRSKYAITAMIAIPSDEKSKTLLLGNYFSPEETVQIVVPRKVIESLLARVVMVRSYLLTAIGLVSSVTIAMFVLVIVLSIRLRRSELTTMWKMGCSPYRIASILSGQIAIILLASVCTAALLAFATNQVATQLVRFLIL